MTADFRPVHGSLLEIPLIHDFAENEVKGLSLFILAIMVRYTVVHQPSRRRNEINTSLGS